MRSRYVSPAGLVLALLCFALPFVAVSCESKSAALTAEYTGFDLVTGDEPDTLAKGVEETAEKERVVLGVQPLAVITVLAAVAGIAVMLIPTVRTRVLAGVVACVVATLALVGNQLVVVDRLVTEVARSDAISDTVAEDVVDTRRGFWLALIVLLVVTAYNAVAAIQVRRTSAGDGAGERLEAD